MLDRKFKRDTLIGYAAQATNVACTFGFMAVVTRWGGLEIFGAATLLISLGMVLANLVSFRTNEAVVAFVKQGDALGDPRRGKFALVAGIALDLTAGALCASLIRWQDVTVARLLLGDAALAPQVRDYAWVMMLLFARMTPLAFMQSRGRFVPVYAIETTERVLKLVLLGATIARTGTLGLGDVVHVLLVGAAAALVVPAGYVAATLAGPLRRVALATDRVLLREYARFSGTTFVSSALKAGNQNIDTLVLGALTDVRIAGIYGMFRQFVAPFGFLSTPLAALSYPRFVEAVASRRRGEVRATIVQVNRRLTRAYIAAAMVMVPLMLGYVRYNAIELTLTQLLAFALMLLAALNNGMLWWARPFSNSVDPRLSVVSNFFATVFLALSIYPVTWAFGMTGTAAVMCALALWLTRFWRQAMDRHA